MDQYSNLPLVSMDASPQRLCDFCSKPLVRRDGEYPSWFRDRRFCGKTCASRQAMKNRWAGTGHLVDKTCVICGDSFPKKKGEKPIHYRSRATCSKQCAGKLRVMSIGLERAKRIGQFQRARNPLKPRKCPVCDVIFEKREEESRLGWNKRKTCSKECADELMIRHRAKVEEPIKYCTVCGVLLERRSDEMLAWFRRRLTCSTECRAIQRVKTNKRLSKTSSLYPPEWTATLRRKIRERDGNRCQQCGQFGGGRLPVVHHIDYIKSNCRESNLIALCTPCHSRTNFDRGKWRAIFEDIILRRGIA